MPRPRLLVSLTVLVLAGCSAGTSTSTLSTSMSAGPATSSLAPTVVASAETPSTTSTPPAVVLPPAADEASRCVLWGTDGNVRLTFTGTSAASECAQDFIGIAHITRADPGWVTESVDVCRGEVDDTGALSWTISAHGDETVAEQVCAGLAQWAEQQREVDAQVP